MRLPVVLVACAAPVDAPAPSEHWDLGEALPCDTPRAQASWHDATAEWAETWTDTPPAQLTPQNPGALVLVGGPTDWGLVWGEPNGLGRYDSRTGTRFRASRPETPMALARADLDGDGSDDLLVAGRTVTVLWGAASADGADGTTSDISAPRPDAASVTDMAAGDLDEDGDPDVVVVYTSPDTANQEGMRAHVLRNDGGRAFAEFPVPGDATLWGPAFHVSIRDVDEDGHLDVTVCNDMGHLAAPNRVFLGDGALGLTPRHGDGLDVPMSCMGLSWGDTDADGVLELYVAESLAHYLFDRTDDGAWVSTAAARGVADVFGPHDMVWGSTLEDFDNDGHMELFAANGDFWIANAVPHRSWWYAFVPEGPAEDILDARGFPATHARGVVARDLNADGLPDLVVPDSHRTPHVLRSDGCTADAWLEVEAPPGSEILVEAAGVRRAVRVDTESGWGSAADARAHVGLGAATSVERVTVTFPGGATDILEGPFSPRRRLRVRP